MPRDYDFWVYIVTNRNDSVLYIGVTNSLSRRTWKHREGKKTALINRMNPSWLDLGADVLQDM